MTVPLFDGRTCRNARLSVGYEQIFDELVVCGGSVQYGLHVEFLNVFMLPEPPAKGTNTALLKGVCHAGVLGSYRAGPLYRWEPASFSGMASRLRMNPSASAGKTTEVSMSVLQNKKISESVPI